jgi:hypothetical protein
LTNPAKTWRPITELERQKAAEHCLAESIIYRAIAQRLGRRVGENTVFTA